MTFKLGTNPDIAAVQTQNKVNVALPRLPPEVQRQGVIGQESIDGVSDGGRLGLARQSLRLAVSQQLRANQSAEPTGQPARSRRFAAHLAQVYSMRVWVDPDKMAKLGLTATDVSNAINGAEPPESGGFGGTGARAAGNRFSICGELRPGRLSRSPAVRRTS